MCGDDNNEMGKKKETGTYRRINLRTQHYYTWVLTIRLKTLQSA